MASCLTSEVTLLFIIRNFGWLIVCPLSSRNWSKGLTTCENCCWRPRAEIYGSYPIFTISSWRHFARVCHEVHGCSHAFTWLSLHSYYILYRRLRVACRPRHVVISRKEKKTRLFDDFLNPWATSNFNFHEIKSFSITVMSHDGVAGYIAWGTRKSDGTRAGDRAQGYSQPIRSRIFCVVYIYQPSLLLTIHKRSHVARVTFSKHLSYMPCQCLSILTLIK